jgi:hypothetical protein
MGGLLESAETDEKLKNVRRQQPEMRSKKCCVATSRTGLKTNRENCSMNAASGLPATPRRAVFALRPVTVLSQPQMKKYRCLWGMSTANHKI